MQDVQDHRQEPRARSGRELFLGASRPAAVEALRSCLAAPPRAPLVGAHEPSCQDDPGPRACGSAWARALWVVGVESQPHRARGVLAPSQDRHERGYVPFGDESIVPDTGGLGWRTKTGHMVKNQARSVQDRFVHASGALSCERPRRRM